MRTELSLETSRIVDFAEREVNQVLAHTRDLKFDASHALHLHSVTLLGSVLELSESCITLCRLTRFTGVPVLARAVLEAFVDLKNLCADPQYGYSLELDDKSFWQDIHKEMRGPRASVYDSLSQEEGLEEALRAHGRRIRELKKRGIRRLSKKEKFEKAEMGDEYKVVYSDLCAQSHHSFSALMNRHVQHGSGKNQVGYFNIPDYKQVRLYLHFARISSIEGGFLVHRLLNSEHVEALDSLRRELLESYCRELE